jgi:lysozyme
MVKHYCILVWRTTVRKEMRTNKKGIEIVKHFEGFRSRPYRCSAGIPTIGYGACYYPDGTRVTMGDRQVSKDQAEELLVYGLRTAEKAVARLVGVPLTVNAFSSLSSFVFNVGSSRFRSSTLRQRLNRKNYAQAAMEFPKWRRGGGVILPGLVRRRSAERELFLLPDNLT